MVNLGKLSFVMSVMFNLAAATGNGFCADKGDFSKAANYSLEKAESPQIDKTNNNFSVEHFDFKQQLFGDKQFLIINITEFDTASGRVVISGVDLRRPQIPFTFDWGDGSVSQGWFPQEHIYHDRTQNYIVKVTSHYPFEKTDFCERLIRFIPAKVKQISLPSYLEVQIPRHSVKLTSRVPGYGVPENLTYFDDSYFSVMPRLSVEYILRIASAIQYDFVNNNVYMEKGKFSQAVLKNSSFQGMYAFWYTNPVSIGAGDYAFQKTIEYSSLFHEMGHNYTLNTPKHYCYGDKIDGYANAIFFESMAQIFQHATAYELVNNYDKYGLSKDMAWEVKQSAVSTMRIVRDAYDKYIDSGKHFFSWNDPVTPQDDTFNTFMVIAYKFCSCAESSGLGYKAPLKRMMEFFQRFDEDIRKQYDQHSNNRKADTFRAAFIVAALSYAFSQDLREDFRELNFPIDDNVYNELVKNDGER